MKLMKVLFVIDTLQGSGAERSLVEIAQNFKKYTPVFVHIYEGNMLVPQLKAAGIKVYSLNVPMPRNFPLAQKELEQVYKIEKPDIIHSSLFKSDAVTRKLKSKYNTPLVSSFVNNSYSSLRFKEETTLMKLKLRLVQLYDAYSSRKVDFFISNSETIKKAKSKSTMVSEDKVKVIFRGRDINKFSNNKGKDLGELKNYLGVSTQNVLLNVGRLIERKGQMDLINAMPAILEKFPKTVLLIAGHGDFKTTMEDRIRELNLQNNIRLLGRRQDVPDLLEISDIFVFPTYFEGLPGSLIEAMLAEKVIVCSDIPENKECVNSQSAVFFKRGDVEDLAKKVIFSMENKMQLEPLGKEARKLAIEKFDIQNIAREYENTYDNILI